MGMIESEVVQGSEGKMDAERRRKDELVATLVERQRLSEEKVQGRIRAMLLIRRIYRGMKDEAARQADALPGEDDKGVGSLELYRNIEYPVSTMSAILNGDDPNWMAWDPDTTDQSNAGLFHVQNLLEKGHEMSGLRSRNKRAIRVRKLYGRVQCEVSYEREYVWKSSMQPVVDATGQATGQQQKVYEEVVDHEYPVLDPLPPWRVFTENGNPIKKSGWVCIKRSLTPHQLSDMMENRRRLGITVYPLPEESGPGGGTTGSATQAVVAGMQTQAGILPTPEREIEMLHFYGRHPDKKRPDKEDERDTRLYDIALINGRDLVWEGVMDYAHGKMPVLESVDNPEDETGEGLGAGQLLLEHQLLVNESDSDVNRAQKLDIMGMFNVTGAPSSWWPENIRARPGRAFHDAVNGRVERMNLNLVQTIRNSQVITDRRIASMRSAVGASASMQGMPTESGLAVDARQAGAAAAQTMAEETMTFANDIFRPFLRMEAELYQQYRDPNDEVVTPITQDGQTFNVRAKMADLPLSTMMPRIKIALDIAFRDKMTRNLNQWIAQVTAFIKTVGEVIPEGAGDVFAALLPTITGMFNKGAAINGVSGNLIPADLVQHVQKLIAQKQLAMQMQQQQEAQMRQALIERAGQGGSSVPVA